MSIRNLDLLLEPKSVVVVGASDRVGSVGATVWRNLRAGLFAGPIYAVNPRHSMLAGAPVYARPADLPQVPDLAVLCTPATTVAALIDKLGRLGTRAAIVMTAGMSAAQKQATLDAARPFLLRVLGPNCLGLLTPHLGLNASFAHTDALPGEVAFVSQSGALVTAVLDWAKSRRIGFSHMVSLGERADVDFGDLLDYLASDARTRSILLYIESIEAPRKFMSAARAAARNKPVIVVKAGRAGNGLKAAASHTGALAGSDLVFDAAIRRAGMLRVDTLQDLFMATETLARFGGNRDEALTVMTNGGGAGVMAADAAAGAGIALPELNESLLNSLPGATGIDLQRRKDHPDRRSRIGRRRCAGSAHQFIHPGQELPAAVVQRPGPPQAGRDQPGPDRAGSGGELDHLARWQGLDVQPAQGRAVPPQLRRVHLG